MPKVRLIAAAITTSLLLVACGGAADDGFDLASTANASSRNTSAFTVASPTANMTASGTVTVKGTTGSNWTAVSVVDMKTGNKVARDAVPANGVWTTSVDSTRQVNGVHTWRITATNKSGATSVQNILVTVSNTKATATPATVTKPATSSIFYGVNGHNNEGGAYDISSTALQLSQLQDLGAKIYRNEVYSQSSANHLATVADAMAAGGVTVYPVLLSDINFNSEGDAYNAGYALGQQTASARKYPYYEVSNELESAMLLGNVDGVYAQQFDNAKFQLARGVIRGMIAGIRSVDTAGKIIIGGGSWLHYAFDQMLANGTQPDGTTGHPVVTWDITSWHWYSDQGDMTNACGGTGCHDVLATLAQFGKPIWLTEFGVRPWIGSDDQIAAYLVGNAMMAQFVSVASKYNIQSIQTYELYDDPDGGEGNYGLVKNDGKTIKAGYTAFKNFVKANPK